MDDYRKFVEKNLTDMDYLEEKSKSLERKEVALWLLLPENEEALRKFFMLIATSAVAASRAKKSEFKLNVEGWVNYQVSRLRKNKKFREKFLRDYFGS